ncbi:substrate-binding domain-containing protein [Clostridium cibarium]|uniref:D-galactose/methyl-galactoside binding periplasmic protein MglB n=1 Tax=Clostridium cibarium TaxID=2762247 RepID=A0ABR8PQY0_9CLOT|nr:galactose ABC transporter substrate-binding protein [Clostridium cibarium]
MLIIQLPSFTPKAIENYSEIPTGRPLKVAALFYSYNDIFLSLIRKRFEDIQKENESKVKFTFFDAKSNNIAQLENINNSIEGDFDFVILNMVEKRKDVVEEIFSKFKIKNIPVILIAADIPETDAFSTYNKAFVLISDAVGSGIAQGKLIADIWKNNKTTMDKNNDGTLQYIIIKGKETSPYTIERSRYSISTINNSGIKTQELASVPAEWDKEEAKNMVSSLFLKYGNKIESIISNNDAMAIGAIEALQKYGYNMGDKLKTIPVFGLDGIDEAKDLIKKGYMTGTVFQDPVTIANAAYTVGINLFSDKISTKDTNLKLNGKEIIIPMVYEPIY